MVIKNITGKISWIDTLKKIGYVTDGRDSYVFEFCHVLGDLPNTTEEARELNIKFTLYVDSHFIHAINIKII